LLKSCDTAHHLFLVAFSGFVMTIVIRNQIEASEKSAQELESAIGRDHHEAAICFDLQDLARSEVTLLADINRDVERWQKSVAETTTGDAEESANCEKNWDALYRRLQGVFEKTAKLIQAMEERKFSIDGKAEFLKAWRDLRGVVCFSLEGISAACEQVRTGNVKPLSEIKRGLFSPPNG
jgi:hypothetical protein